MYFIFRKILTVKPSMPGHRLDSGFGVFLFNERQISPCNQIKLGFFCCCFLFFFSFFYRGTFHLLDSCFSYIYVLTKKTLNRSVMLIHYEINMFKWSKESNKQGQTSCSFTSYHCILKREHVLPMIYNLHAKMSRWGSGRTLWSAIQSYQSISDTLHQPTV